MSHRIVMLTSQYLPEVFGGAEQQCQRLSLALVALGHKVTILTSCTDPSLAGERREGPLTVVRLLVKDPPQMMGRRMLSSIKWARATFRWLKDHQNDFDLIHCHQAKFNAWVGTHAAKALGKPSLVKVANAGDRMDLLRLSKKKFLYGRQLARSIMGKVSRFVVISTDMQRDLAAFGVSGDNICYIPNGINPPTEVLEQASTLHRQGHTDFGLPVDALVFLFAGRLERQKNVATLIEAFGQMAHYHPEALLLIVGAGGEDSELKAQAAASIPEDQIRFLGRIENMWPLYAAADCFVLPALAEGLSNALLEAQASALPVIATAVSGTRDFVKHGKSGFLFEPRDVSGLAHHLKTMASMLDAERKDMGRLGQQGVLEHAAMEMVAKRYEALYAELLNPASSTQKAV